MIKETIDRLATRFAIPIAVLVTGGIVGVAIDGTNRTLSIAPDSIAPQGGVELPVVWGDLGKRLVESGAIDREKWAQLYGTLSDEEKRLLEGDSSERLRITPENSSYLLNLFWAFGLANKNPILEKGEMTNPEYGGADGFASTGGWTLSKADAMKHFSKHELVFLVPEEQALVEKISGGIYRPCCDNPTNFPDCNHGMAMLGLLELMASQGASEKEMWDAALAVNSYWFPDTYQTIATYMKMKGVEWDNVDPREVLGYEYSSYSGYQRVLSKVQPEGQEGAKCSV